MDESAPPGEDIRSGSLQGDVGTGAGSEVMPATSADAMSRAAAEGREEAPNPSLNPLVARPSQGPSPTVSRCCLLPWTLPTGGRKSPRKSQAHPKGPPRSASMPAPPVPQAGPWPRTEQLPTTLRPGANPRRRTQSFPWRARRTRGRRPQDLRVCRARLHSQPQPLYLPVPWGTAVWNPGPQHLRHRRWVAPLRNCPLMRVARDTYSVSLGCLPEGLNMAGLRATWGSLLSRMEATCSSGCRLRGAWPGPPQRDRP
eukprot:jgi/Botrbrau1/1555/Bobra.0107s0043.1